MAQIQRWRPSVTRSRGRVVAPDLTIVELPAPGGGEDVLITTAGQVVTGLANGDVVRLEDGRFRVLGNTGGRPLGIEELPDGTFLICDHDLGLVGFDPASGDTAVVVGDIAGEHLHFCSNAVVLADGTTYLSSSSPSASVDGYRDDAVAHVTRGGFYRLDPADNTVTVLRDDLAFANGVALAPDESFVLVAETLSYRISRYWLSGPRAGKWDYFVDGLPGFPDNISIGSDGLLWVSLPAPRQPVLDFLLPRNPLLRRALMLIPERLQPQPADVVWVQAYDLTGTLVHDYETKHRDFGFVTAVAERDGVVWLSALHNPNLAKFVVED
ncbi:SMP-30/gluconolactonase/LRE family protein [Antrihabitans sp. NCIMB 15449]|uniref:SMP-30/gluconolactonase/LRE family protein n=1 Tax=Antrihabitans spumae TaxID=3373370 RepID=A0ABW7JV73_9NOCA